jgi:hypothetical protein
MLAAASHGAALDSLTDAALAVAQADELTSALVVTVIAGQSAPCAANELQHAQQPAAKQGQVVLMITSTATSTSPARACMVTICNTILVRLAAVLHPRHHQPMLMRAKPPCAQLPCPG